MARCAFCRTVILFGGIQDGEDRYCNDRCEHFGYLTQVTRALSASEVQQQVLQIRNGLCPMCRSSGPIDVHTSYRVWSALFLTSWRSVPHICCRACGIRKQLSDLAFSLLLGWWGFPWGLIVTPVQVGRNILGMVRPPDPMVASKKLEQQVRIELGAQLLAAEMAEQTS